MAIFFISSFIMIIAFTYKFKLVTKVLIGLVVAFSFLIILDEFYFMPDKKRVYGCVEKRKDVFRSMPKLFIKVEGKLNKYSIYNSKTGWANNLIGECVYFTYYKNIYGNNVFLRLEGERNE